MRYEHALSPINLGPVKVQNRVVRTGHATGLGGGTISDELIDYHRARARGGVGLTILEMLAVGTSAYPFLHEHAPGRVEGYLKLMAAVRPYGMRVFQQIGHLGNDAPELDGSPPWSSSDNVGPNANMQASPMTMNQIDSLVRSYAEAARACAAGELDGVELHMSHGYLVQQFLSPLFNARDDEYGGAFENRCRLAVELLEAVREELPPSMALGVRLGSEAVEGGLTPDDVADIASYFETRGLIDYVNLSLGSSLNTHRIVSAMHEPAGYELPFDAATRREVALPILVTGRFRTLEEVEQVIRTGEADLVGMTRAHIADPDLIRKTIETGPDSVRPCIGCNHGCVGGLMSAGRIGCTVNAAVGAEATLSEDLIISSASPKNILVVGGGPAGMEAARVAALRGHRVTLAEASNKLGGCVEIAKRAPKRGGIGDITAWLENEIFRLGVEVRLGTYIDAADVDSLNPDVVIVATGSQPRMDGRQMFAPGHHVEGVDLPHVVSSHDVLTGSVRLNSCRQAFIFDDVGHYEGLAVAEFLVGQGVPTSFATSHASFAPGLEASMSAFPGLERLAGSNTAFDLLTYVKLEEIGPDFVRIGRRYGGAPTCLAADLVVLVTHNRCNTDLVESLADKPFAVVAAGDVRSPRFLQTAIREGHMAARSIA